MSDQHLGKYRLLDLIATGGMGEVFLARQEGPVGFSKVVVIKRILQHLAQDAAFVNMFLDEARLAAQLSHPNIVQITELGEHDGQYFIAMEHLHGKPLRLLRHAAAARNERVPPVLVARILAQALHGLHYAHTALDPDGKPLNIVHRDISPDNIMVTYSGTVKVLDFGIAKASSVSSNTRSGTVKGKYAYMAPEQLLSQPLDGRTDIYAAGVVMYELLAGTRPMVADSEGALVRLILDVEPPSLLERAPGTPPGLAALVHQALQKERSKRFASAEDFAVALEGWADAAAATATVPSIQAYMRVLFSNQSGDFPAVVTPTGERRLPSGTHRLPTPARPGVPPDVSRGEVDVELNTMAGAGRPASPRVTWVLAALLGLGGAALAGGVFASRSGERAAPVEGSAAVATVHPRPEVADAGAEGLAPTAVVSPAVPDPGSERVDAGASVAREDRAAPKARGNKGKVDLRVSPWGEVFEGDRSLGVTPFAPIELSAGVHTLQVKNSKLNMTRTVRVVVTPGRTTAVRVDLLD